MSTLENSKKSSSTYLYIGTIILLTLVIVGVVIWQQYVDSRTPKSLVNSGESYANVQTNDSQQEKTPGQKAEEEADSIYQKVSRLTSLPDEKPMIATVTDVGKLRGQAFFDLAEDGDKILVFTTAKKAVLYRESTNTIINIEPIATTKD